MKKRYLTKSRFKVGYGCPTKLFYLDNKQFGNNNTDNSFLEALAEGGFQVGELAKIYHPGGTEITTIDKDVAAQETADLLKKENVVIYEASFKYENLFIKADVLVKKGNHVELIEVKAKSFDPTEEDVFFTKASLKKGSPKLNSAWEPYIVDIAFQTYVFKKSFPNLKVSSYLMLANKTAVATVDGINQRFFLEKDENGRAKVIVAEGTKTADLGAKLLVKVPVDEAVRVAWEMTFDASRSFEETISYLSKVCADQSFEKPLVGSHCKSCEFRIAEKDKESGLKSGFENCWSQALALKPTDFNRPLVFDIWNFRKAGKLIETGVYFADQLTEEDVSPTPRADEPGLSNSERQWLQVEKIQQNDSSATFNVRDMAAEIKSWTYPLHFIDFETTMVAIPFHKGRHPYEQIAFQFSHHMVTEDGKIIHRDQYINQEKGHFPNFDFVRTLMGALSNDNGTIFRYATHENTVLCQIRQQLLDSEEPISDRDELIEFIESITMSGENSSIQWEGPRNMVDMCELVKKFLYLPETKGSNSIKAVLPAILNDSEYLQTKYSSPIYGSDKSIESLNFKNWTWIEKDLNGKVVNPYKRLPTIFSDLDLDTMDSLITDGSIADGGAAMTAYARMQFTQMSAKESDRVAMALLKYCELDTFAMVMIYEYWKHTTQSALEKAA